MKLHKIHTNLQNIKNGWPYIKWLRFIVYLWIIKRFKVQFINIELYYYINMYFSFYIVKKLDLYKIL